jgi:hypothetical protein
LSLIGWGLTWASLSVGALILKRTGTRFNLALIAYLLLFFSWGSCCEPWLTGQLHVLHSLLDEAIPQYFPFVISPVWLFCLDKQLIVICKLCLNKKWWMGLWDGSGQVHICTNRAKSHCQALCSFDCNSSPWGMLHVLALMEWMKSYAVSRSMGNI